MVELKKMVAKFAICHGLSGVYVKYSEKQNLARYLLGLCNEHTSLLKLTYICTLLLLVTLYNS